MKNVSRVLKSSFIWVLTIFLGATNAWAQSAKYIPYRKGNLWGYCSPNKSIVIAPKYQKASRFNGDIAIVQNSEGRYLLINDRGVEISKSYDRIGEFNDGMARVVANGWLGFIDRSGKEVIDLAYEDEVESVFKNGLAKVSKTFHDGKKWGFINKQGKEVVPIKYRYLEDFYSGMAIYETSVDGYGYIDNNGNEAIPADPNNRITQALHFGNGDRTLIKRNGIVVLINKSGDVIKTYKSEDIGWRYEKVIMVGQSGHWGFIDNDGNIIAPLMYDEDQWGDLPFQKDRGLGVVSINGQWGVINQQNQPIVPFQYEGIEVFPNNLISVWKTGESGEYQYGVVSREGEVLPMRFRQVKICDNGYVFAADNYQWQLYNKNGQKVSSQDYYSVDGFSEGVSAVTRSLNGKYGYIDMQGNTSIPYKYNLATGFKDGIALVIVQGKEGYINKEGVEYWD